MFKILYKAWKAADYSDRFLTVGTTSGVIVFLTMIIIGIINNNMIFIGFSVITGVFVFAFIMLIYAILFDCLHIDNFME